jgi:CBS-domain-containing membrane protein
MSRQPLVADVMAVDPIAVDLGAPLEEADRLLRSTYVTGIPVVDGDGVLVGVIGHAHLTAYRYTRLSFSNDPEKDPLRERDASRGERGADPEG